MCTMTRTKDGENEVFSTKIGGWLTTMEWNKVYQADPLCSTYHFDHWLYTWKWWWAIWLWWVQLLLGKAYVMYRAAHLYIWKSKESNLISHYNFQKMMALHLINPKWYPLDCRQQLKQKSDDADVWTLWSGSGTIPLAAVSPKELLPSMIKCLISIKVTFRST
jgi:hypothetical protein